MIDNKDDAQESVRTIIREFRKTRKVIRGSLALAIGFLCHEAGLDHKGQWGNLYFRCPRCGQAVRDCDGQENWEYGVACDTKRCDEEGVEVTVADLRLSEGWVDREVVGLPA